jgi:hypothetical protein
MVLLLFCRISFANPMLVFTLLFRMLLLCLQCIRGLLAKKKKGGKIKIEGYLILSQFSKPVHKIVYFYINTFICIHTYRCVGHVLKLFIQFCVIASDFKVFCSCDLRPFKFGVMQRTYLFGKVFSADDVFLLYSL